MGHNSWLQGVRGCGTRASPTRALRTRRPPASLAKPRRGLPAPRTCSTPVTSVWSCSLSFAVRLLATHNFLLQKWEGSDALFVHADWADRGSGGRFALDEFHAYRHTFLMFASTMWTGFSREMTREWFYGPSLSTSLEYIKGNFTLARSVTLNGSSLAASTYDLLRLPIFSFTQTS